MSSYFGILVSFRGKRLAVLIMILRRNDHHPDMPRSPVSFSTPSDDSRFDRLDECDESYHDRDR